jgi:hypothetical protein
MTPSLAPRIIPKLSAFFAVSLTADPSQCLAAQALAPIVKGAPDVRRKSTNGPFPIDFALLRVSKCPI